VAKVFGAFVWGDGFERSSDGLSEAVEAAGRRGSDEGLELGEDHPDRVEVGRVGREEAQLGAGRLDGGAGTCGLVDGEVVADRDVAVDQGGGELRLDPERDPPAICRPLHRHRDVGHADA
jgi:hypothetical protein